MTDSGALVPYASPYARAIQQQSSIAYAPNPYAIQPAAPVKPPSVWETYRQVLAPQQQTTQVQSAVTGIRHNLEAAAIASLLGLIHGRLGTLDIKGRYPVDGIAALAFYLLSVKEAGRPDGFASDFAAMSQSCTSVALFRKTDAWSRPKDAGATAGDAKTVDAAVMSGHNPKADPLVEAARKLGFVK